MCEEILFSELVTLQGVKVLAFVDDEPVVGGEMGGELVLLLGQQVGQQLMGAQVAAGVQAVVRHARALRPIPIQVAVVIQEQLQVITSNAFMGVEKLAPLEQVVGVVFQL